MEADFADAVISRLQRAIREARLECIVRRYGLATAVEAYQIGAISWDRHQFGPPPGEYGCVIPDHILAAVGEDL